jgi:HEAT repeat protein
VNSEDRDNARATHPLAIVSEAADRGDIAFLVDALTDPEMRTSAAQRLGDLRAREAVPTLIRSLRIGNDLTRNSVVKSLGKIGDPSAVPALIDVAQQDEAAGVRITAIDSVAMLDHPRGIEMLTRLVVDPRALFIGTSRYMDIPLFRATSARMLRSTQRWAAKRLRELKATQAVPTLQASLRSTGLRNGLRIRRTIRSLKRLQT